MAPTESVASAAETVIPNGSFALDGTLAGDLWRGCDAASWGLTREEFDQILLDAGTAQNFGRTQTPAPTEVTRKQQADFFRGLRVGDLALARACASGNGRAWEHFVAVYRQPLTRDAIAITRSETLGRDLADQLYAELYGLKVREGERRCPLLSYRGRGSLMGWLRTTLAQRHVDHYRRTRREEPVEEFDAPAPAPPQQQTPARELSLLEQAIKQAISSREAEERYLLATYYLDGQTLLAMGRVLGVHEATVSRKLRRAEKEIRKQILKHLQRSGMSRRAAEEAMGADARDLEVNLKKLLQNSQSEAFQEQATT
jgi:RNA polymerase sigma-70 factor (ECF subfamily)